MRVFRANELVTSDPTPGMLRELAFELPMLWAGQVTTAPGAVSVRSEDAVRLTHVAKAYCSDALDRIAGETIQLHGGIAITWEHDAHLVFKRAHALGQLFGQAHEHRAAVEL